jgi:flagellar motility protein MotE (MotC chaperone)
MEDQLDYHEIKYRLETNGVFRILRKDRAAFMLGFLHDQFKRRHQVDIGQSRLCDELSAYADFIRLAEGGEDPKREPTSYLDEWANDGFLRKFYPPGSAEACYDLTPDSERALEWLSELARRSFVGTESRLLALFEALKDLAFGAAYDPEERKAELERQRAAIDAELARLEKGDAPTLDPTKILERYYGVEDAARRLLADFKQVEQNFRDLDRETKERVIASEGARGQVLKEVFEHRDAIVSSDQGKSFQAFWGFLMSIETREELVDLIHRITELEVVRKANRGFPLDSLDQRLVAAGARVQNMTHRLNGELRRFLDERARSESKRVGELIEAFKRLALQQREDPPLRRAFMSIEGDSELSLVMDRPLYEPELPVIITQQPLSTGQPAASADALFDLDRIDLSALAGNIRSCLMDSGQASLAEVASRFPVTQGTAELLGYLDLAATARAGMDSGLGVHHEVADSGQRTLLQGRNERRRARFAADTPNPVFLPELQP